MEFAVVMKIVAFAHENGATNEESAAIMGVLTGTAPVTSVSKTASKTASKDASPVKVAPKDAETFTYCGRVAHLFMERDWSWLIIDGPDFRAAEPKIDGQLRVDGFRYTAKRSDEQHTVYYHEAGRMALPGMEVKPVRKTTRKPAADKPAAA